LTSLAYLWDRDQTELLKEMIDSGMHAILIKVAALGLQPDKHLGKTIAELYDHFVKIVIN
jgi:diphthine-ammonia ligase